MTNRSGFTLLELLVVLVVISLATALVAPAFDRGLDNFRGQQHMRELASTLRNLRREAIETGRVVALTADYETDQLLVNGAQAIPLPHTLSLEAISASLPAELGGDGEHILFYPDGSSSGGILRLVATNGPREIAVNWFTGDIALDSAQ